MLICGVAATPTDCGYEMGAGNISPRLGLAYRLNDAIVVRGGYGINYDPYPLAFVRNLLGNYPSSINLSLPQASAFAPTSKLSDGIPPIPVPDVSSGVIPVPLNVSARALPDKPEARLHPFMERDRAGGAAWRIYGPGGLRRHAAARHQPDHGCQRRPGDRRGQCRPSAVCEVRPHRARPAFSATRAGATTTRCRRL